MTSGSDPNQRDEIRREPPAWALDESALLAAARGAAPRRDDGPRVPGLAISYEIGRGGQGVVYAARDERSRREVAVKILSITGVGDRADRARVRFRREIDAVRALDHPGIVRTLDHGTLDDGRPYLVMERVDGPLLDEYVLGADRSAVIGGGGAAPVVPLERVVGLLIDIADALEHAHARGVIHRDMKPQNVRIDAEGRPRVLDFGLARALAVDDSALPMESLTRTGGVLGTLAWASPEQLAGRPNDVDARSDVYAVGALLYQMLTGRFPQDLTGALRDVVQRLERDEPAPPSRFVGCPSDLDTVDLDTVVLCALARRPEDRYQTMRDLRRDLERLRDGEPVEVRRAGAWRRVQQSLRRWRRVAALAAVVGIVAAGGAVALAVLTVRAQEAESLAERRRDDAVTAMHRAEATIAFLEETLTYGDPAGAGVPDAAARRMLDRTAARLDFELGPDPLVRGAVTSIIGRAYANLGASDRAADLLVGAVRDLRAARARMHDDSPAAPSVDERLLVALESLGIVRHAQGRRDDAARVFASAAARAEPGPVATRIAVRRAVLEADRGDLEAARTLLEPALAAARGGDPTVTALVLYRLGMVLHHQGERERAGALLEEALSLYETWEGVDAMRTAECLVAIAAFHGNGPDPASALPTLERARSIYETRIGPRCDRVAECAGLKASVLVALGESEAAAAEYEDAIAILTESLGPRHARVGYAKGGYGNVLRTLGRHAEAQAAWDDALAILRRAFGPRHPRVGSILIDRAYGWIDTGQQAEALDALRAGVPVLRAARGPGDARVVEAEAWIDRLERALRPEPPVE